MMQEAIDLRSAGFCPFLSDISETVSHLTGLYHPPQARRNRKVWILDCFLLLLT